MTFVMIPAGVLVYRDDTGEVGGRETGTAKAKLFPKKPVLGMFLVMFVIINVSYFAYGGWFCAHQGRVAWRRRSRAHGPIRRRKSMIRRASTRRTVHEGPYSVGKWSTWQRASAGRPARRRTAAAKASVVRPENANG